MKFLKRYVVQIVFAIAFIAIVNIVYTDNQSLSTKGNRIMPYNNQWNIEVDDCNTFYKELPNKIKRDTFSPISLTKKLPHIISQGDAISFYSHHQSIQVFVNTELIYSFTVPTNSKSKTPGNAWHFIDLSEDYAEQEIKLIISPIYKSDANTVPEFQYGHTEDLIISILKADAHSLFVCMIMLIVGMFILFYVVISRKEGTTPHYVIWLGLSLIILSLWSCADRPIVTVIVRNYLLTNYIQMISLKLVTIPIIMFVKHIYKIKKNTFINFICVASIIDFNLSIVLQLIGILDFKQTLFVTHFIFLLGMIWVLYRTIAINIKQRGRLTKENKLHIGFVYFVALTVLLDLFNYYVTQGTDSSKFSRIGVLTYTLVLVYHAINNSAMLLRSKEQVEEIKVFAKHDAITKLKNRIAFEEDINEITLSGSIDYGVAVFDLNNLKEFNDLYGHNMGDYYIIISSEIIQDLFGEYGTVYRIGGDEFCAILKNVTSTFFVNLEEKMNRRIAELNGTYFDREMSIASGYAEFIPNMDINIYSAFQRADQQMYDNKRTMKNSSIICVENNEMNIYNQ